MSRAPARRCWPAPSTPCPGRPGAFVAVNCGGIAASLLESQLFGARQGRLHRRRPRRARLRPRAPTAARCSSTRSATSRYRGQAALLRVLQEREVAPVGGSRRSRSTCGWSRPRTGRSVGCVPRGEFRADLLARLAGYRHQRRRCAARREDLGLIVGDLLRGAEPRRGRPPPRAATPGAGLFAHGWPLNIRELQQSLTVAAAPAPRGVLEAEHLLAPCAAPRPRPPPRSRRISTTPRRSARSSSRSSSSTAATSATWPATWAGADADPPLAAALRPGPGHVPGLIERPGGCAGWCSATARSSKRRADATRSGPRALHRATAVRPERLGDRHVTVTALHAIHQREPRLADASAPRPHLPARPRDGGFDRLVWSLLQRLRRRGAARPPRRATTDHND